MKTQLTSLILPLFAGALIAVSATAQTTPNTPTTPPRDNDNGHSRYSDSPTAPGQTTTSGKSGMKEVSRGDHRFFKKAAMLGEKEVALSRIAAERAVNPQVRAFASEMVRAHTTANTELAGLMKHRGVMIDTGDQATEQRELAKKWNGKKADGFDEDYLEAMIDCHEDTIDVLENGVDSKDTDVAAYAAQLLPAVKAHLAQAERLQELVD
jgi:putative membrane protein